MDKGNRLSALYLRVNCSGTRFSKNRRAASGVATVQQSDGYGRERCHEEKEDPDASPWRECVRRMDDRGHLSSRLSGPVLLDRVLDGGRESGRNAWENIEHRYQHCDGARRIADDGA